MKISRIIAIIIVVFIFVSYYLAFREVWYGLTSLPKETALIPFFFILKQSIKFINELKTK